MSEIISIVLCTSLKILSCVIDNLDILV